MDRKLLEHTTANLTPLLFSFHAFLNWFLNLLIIPPKKWSWNRRLSTKQGLFLKHTIYPALWFQGTESHVGLAGNILVMVLRPHQDQQSPMEKTVHIGEEKAKENMLAVQKSRHRSLCQF